MTMSNKPLTPPPSVETAEQQTQLQTQQNLTAQNCSPLKPHILSPSPEEFLLTTGTAASEPGVGMFVNLDGDVTRTTLEFDQYPRDVVLDGRGIDVEVTQDNSNEDEEGYIIAVVDRQGSDP